MNFDVVLANPEMKEAFTEHLIEEFAVENLKFYERVVAWEKAYETTNAISETLQPKPFIVRLLSLTRLLR